MKNIGILKNTVQEYEWGSFTAIPELLGNDSPANTPQAELWMGAHPKAPSKVKLNGRWMSLMKLIEKNPKDILGKEVAEKYSNRLPYLFKVLAAAKPLSIQAHPSLAQANEGYMREDSLGIPLNAYNRNYKDDNHKPECICALTFFWALNGFRKISGILALLEKICPQGLKSDLNNLRGEPNSQGLKNFFQAIMTMDSDKQNKIIAEAIINAQKFSDDDQAYKWMIDLHNEYPADIGVFSPILLNLICLKPGQAMFLPAGELHAYLDGVGIELMANSDNVLRGGLTPKHVDVPELLNVLNFEERELDILSPIESNECERIYASHADEFVLSVIGIKKDLTCYSPDNRSVEILLCTDGEATITDLGNNDKLAFDRGKSIIIPSAVKRYCIEGNATLYKAGVPV
jgi:mannose-6-phosphate isomerase